MKPTPQAHEVYVQRSRFGKRSCAHLAGYENPEQPGIHLTRCRLCGGAMPWPVDADHTGSWSRDYGAKPKSEPAGSRLVVKLGDAIGRARFVDVSAK